ncbi:MAG: 1-acyl-sn-glycerol-3-phosphate acyltransferase, partial [Pseudomonadota bacterium]
MVIFPEGTRVAVGKTGAYQSGIAALYRHLELPVTPLALNSGLTWGRKAFVKYPGMISAKFLTPIPPGKPKAEFLAALEQVIETETAQLVDEERARR